MIELKPCPFCGGKARLFVSNGVRVLCTKCGATTWTAADSERVGTSAVEDVVKAWNRWKTMTLDQAIRLIDPATTTEELEKIYYYGGFHGNEVTDAAINEAIRREENE